MLSGMRSAPEPSLPADDTEQVTAKEALKEARQTAAREATRKARIEQEAASLDEEVKLVVSQLPSLLPNVDATVRASLLGFASVTSFMYLEFAHHKGNSLGGGWEGICEEHSDDREHKNPNLPHDTPHAPKLNTKQCNSSPKLPQQSWPAACSRCDCIERNVEVFGTKFRLSPINRRRPLIT
jgi:hypothetical protein